jgi:hypothetical protein
LAGTPEPPVTPPVAAAPVRQRRGRALIVVTILLGVALVAAIAAAVWLFLQLDRANDRIEEQRDLIDKKQAFAAALHDLEASTEPMLGLPFGSIVPWDRYEQLAADGWEHRWDAAAMDADILRVQRAEQEMKALQSTAALEIATNASGTAWEATLDQLGKGFVSTRIDDAAASCEAEALGCVFGEEPFMVHLDAASGSDPMMTDWMRTGVAYHEFAHVLQFTNPQPTAEAVTAFGGDMETMADCYALTFLDGWTLDHEVGPLRTKAGRSASATATCATRRSGR